MAEENNKTNSTKVKKPLHRSPNYPVIGLEKAVERVTQLYEQAKLHPLPISTVCEIWKYSPSTGSQNVAALKAFGLVDVTGEKEGRQVKVNDYARKIIMEHPDRPEILKQLVLNPSLYNEVWTKFNGDLPASDIVLRNYLVFERNFNENAVDDFIREFRASISYANLEASDKIDSDTETYRGGAAMENGQTGRQENPTNFQPFIDDFLGNKPKDNAPKQKALFEYSVPLSVQRGVNASLRIDGQSLKKRDLQILAKRVKELIDAFEEEEEENIVRYKAIWHNKDFDIPVIVVSNPETAEDGREYVAIEGSGTRIPYDEVEELEEE